MNAKLSSSINSQPDDDSPEWLTEDFQQARHAADVLPEILGTDQAQILLTRGRPKSCNPKVAVTIRYDAEIIATFRATGPGWQTRMNSALREWLAMRP